MLCRKAGPGGYASRPCSPSPLASSPSPTPTSPPVCRQYQGTGTILLDHALDELLERDRIRLLLLSCPAHVHRHGALLRLALPHHEHVRHLHASALGDPVLERL